MQPSRLLVTLTAVAASFLASCSSEGPGCAPTDPGCGPAGPTVAAISVSAPIDTVMAVGRTTQLSATATEASGSTVSVSFAWSSTAGTVATVDGGTVSAVAEGSASIQASADGETGEWSVRVVDADLDGVGDLLADAFAEALVGSLDASTGSAVIELVADCDAAIASGDVLLVEACLDAAVAVESPQAGSDAGLAVLDLFFQESLRKLRLDG